MRFFIINLRSSNDRRKRMEENIKHIFAQDPSFANEAEFSFFVAHTPSDVKNTGFDKRYSRFLAGIFKAREVRPSEIGCFASHFTLWERCVELNEPIFILEDDVDFYAPFIEGVRMIVASKYDYVRLSWSTFQPMYLLSEHFAFSPHLILGTPGYYITPFAAKRLIKGARKFGVAVDYYMSFSYLHNVPEMLYLPRLIGINELDEQTTIGKPEHQIKDKTFYRRFVLLRELHRVYRDIRMWIFARLALAYLKRLG